MWAWRVDKAHRASGVSQTGAKVCGAAILPPAEAFASRALAMCAGARSLWGLSKQAVSRGCLLPLSTQGASAPPCSASSMVFLSACGTKISSLFPSYLPVLLFLCGAGNEPRASYMPDKCSTAELHTSSVPSLPSYGVYKIKYVMYIFQEISSFLVWSRREGPLSGSSLMASPFSFQPHPGPSNPTPGTN